MISHIEFDMRLNGFCLTMGFCLVDPHLVYFMTRLPPFSGEVFEGP
jgi:hypothetical protein